jgi:hypothetical protein
VHAVVKGITCDQWGLASFVPADPRCFTLSLRLQIGPPDTSSADDFECNVCTPEWLKQAVWDPTWGRHLLVVREYDLAAIEGAIHRYVAGCSGQDWNHIARKLARVFAWEFEDYQA